MSRNPVRKLQRKHGIGPAFGLKRYVKGRDKWRVAGRLKSASQKDTTRAKTPLH